MQKSLYITATLLVGAGLFAGAPVAHASCAGGVCFLVTGTQEGIANPGQSSKPTDKWTTTFGARYSGRQYGQLDNSDTNSFAYLGFSSYFVTDVRVRYQVDKRWIASLGIDNLNNDKYWAFHPYPQRTVVAEVKFDY